MADDTGSWDEMRRAKEDMFFEEQNKKALKKIKKEKEKRKSPITGEPMEQLEYKGVVIDRCSQSGGIWLDAGELEDILTAVEKEKETDENWLGNFFGFISKKPGDDTSG